MDLRTLEFLEESDFDWSEHKRNALCTIRVLAEMLLEEKTTPALRMLWKKHIGEPSTHVRTLQ